MKLQEIREKIKELAEPILGEQGAYLVDIQMRPERSGPLILLFADTDKGITIDQCAHISRNMRSAIEPRNMFDGSDFRLEVSSPGIDKPLTMLRQYPKNIGRTFRVQFTSASETRSISGVLTHVEGDLLTFQAKGGEPLSISFGQIIESKEELPW